jgi:diguanylate cyclase (GGDEF)-like protein
VLFVDLDGFKAVNDSAGHAVGDALLVHAARRLQASVRAEDPVARLGGDEFAALLEGEAGTHPSRARDVAERIFSALTQPYQIAGKEALVSASIGMAVALPGVTPDELLHHADKAMYEAKRAGKARIRMHIPQPYQDRDGPSPEAHHPAIPLQASEEPAAQNPPPAHQGDRQDRSAAHPCVPAAGSAMGDQYNGQSQTQALQHAAAGDHPAEHLCLRWQQPGPRREVGQHKSQQAPGARRLDP